jgi:RNA-directed DNA polymerase
VTADSKEVVEDVKKVIAGFLAKRGLMLSEEKTRITHIDDGFDFLA